MSGSRLSRVSAVAMLAAAALAATAAGRQPGTLDALFPWRAPVSVEPAAEPGGLARLFLPAEVLATVRADLSDLRLLDASGREVPFAVDRDAGLRRRVGSIESAPAAIRSASQSRSQREEIFDWSESYELEAPPAAWREAERGTLQLRAVSERGRFVKRLTVTALDSSGEAEALIDSSLFRLPDPLRERVRFELPTGTRAVRVELVGEDGGWLEPTFVWERETELADRPDPSTVDLPLVESSRTEESGETVVVLERPRGVSPLAIAFETATPLFRRRVAVLDGGPAVPRRELFAGEIRRVGPEESRLALPWPAAARARGSRLEVRVLDQDSPPLADLRVSLRLARPALLFAADARPARLVWGGARVRAARYDVGSLVPTLPAAGDRAALGRATLDESLLADATLGEAEPNPAYDPVSPLEFAMDPGRELDPRRFSHARSLTAPPSAHGLYRLILSAADQAALRPDFGDLRIVDEQARQRPYVLVADSGRERVRAKVRATHPEGETLLRLELPSAPMTVAGLVLEIEDSFFERSYTVEGRLDDARGGASDPEILARGGLRRERSVDGIPAGGSVEIPLPKRRVRSLIVRIADGSDRPLRVTGAEIETPAPEVLFPAAPGSYVALLGEPDLRAPRYELEAVRELVQAIDSTEVERGALAPNEEFSLAVRLRRGSGLERTILGIALVAAVLVLTVVTLRLAGPKPSPADGASGDDGIDEGLEGGVETAVEETGVEERVRDSAEGAGDQDSNRGS